MTQVLEFYSCNSVFVFFVFMTPAPLNLLTGPQNTGGSEGGGVVRQRGGYPAGCFHGRPGFILCFISWPQRAFFTAFCRRTHSGTRWQPLWISDTRRVNYSRPGVLLASRDGRREGRGGRGMLGDRFWGGRRGAASFLERWGVGDLKSEPAECTPNGWRKLTLSFDALALKAKNDGAKKERKQKRHRNFLPQCGEEDNRICGAKLFDKCLSCEMFLDFLQKGMDKTVHVHVLKQLMFPKNVRICYE